MGGKAGGSRLWWELLSSPLAVMGGLSWVTSVSAAGCRFGGWVLTLWGWGNEDVCPKRTGWMPLATVGQDVEHRHAPALWSLSPCRPWASTYQIRTCRFWSESSGVHHRASPWGLYAGGGDEYWGESPQVGESGPGWWDWAPGQPEWWMGSGPAGRQIVQGPAW